MTPEEAARVAWVYHPRTEDPPPLDDYDFDEPPPRERWIGWGAFACFAAAALAIGAGIAMALR